MANELVTGNSGSGNATAAAQALSTQGSGRPSGVGRTSCGKKVAIGAAIGTGLLVLAGIVTVVALFATGTLKLHNNGTGAFYGV